MIVLAFFDYQERIFILSKGVDPDLAKKFKVISRQVSVPGYSKQFPVKSRLLCPRERRHGGKYPLIVFLHGAGERGFDNVAQLKSLPQRLAAEDEQEKYTCFLLAPQCPPKMDWSSETVLIDSTSTAGQKTILLDLVYQLILDISAKHSIDTNRIYITGYSMGGYGTWSMLARYSDLFAAASPLCGGGDPKSVEKFAHIPLWVVHGDADQVIPVTESRKMVEALRMNGGRPEYQELHNVKHDCWSITYNQTDKMLEWLFKQKNELRKGIFEKKISNLELLAYADYRCITSVFYQIPYLLKRFLYAVQFPCEIRINAC